LNVDPDQLEQMMINLVRNAVEAALELGRAAGVGANQSNEGGAVVPAEEPLVVIHWSTSEKDLVLTLPRFLGAETQPDVQPGG
jgi:signal transduction histidine kinase